MSQEVAHLRTKLIDTIKTLSADIQVKTGDKAILERELRHLCTGKRPGAVMEELRAREIALC